MAHLASRALAAFLFLVAVASANTTQVQTATAQTAAKSNGITFGVFGSGAFSEVEFQETLIAPPNTSENATGNIDGAGIGLLIGYDLPIGNGFFIGAEGDIAWGDWKQSYNVSPTLVGYYDIKQMITIRGRAGMEVADGAVIYGTAGYLHAKVEHGLFITPPTAGPIDREFNGWTAGVGGEMSLFGATAFIEWLYLGFGDTSFILHNATT